MLVLIALHLKYYTIFYKSLNTSVSIASNRDDNIGNSSQKRYRVKPLTINGLDIYVSTQFFDSDREAVIEWYKSHL